MTEISRPWQSTTPGDAGPYSSDNWSQLQRYIIGQDGQNVESGIVEGSGVNPDPGLTVTQRGAGANMSVDISAGAALVNGTFYIDDATVNKAIAANASGNPRIDTIILNKDWSAQTIRLAVVQGTPAGSPVPPSLVQNAGVQWQIPLADVAVANGAISITNANLTPRSVPANAPGCICLRGILNNSGVVLQTGDVVVWDATADRAITTTTTASSPSVAGVWIGRTAIGGYGRVLRKGMGYINSSAAVTRGNSMATTTVAKQAAPATVGTVGYEFARAMQTTAGAGLVLCYVDVLGQAGIGYLMNRPNGLAVRDNGADYTSTSDAFTAIDSTNLHKVVVCYGTKLFLAFTCVSSGTTYIFADFDFTVDGTRVGAAGANGLAGGMLPGNVDTVTMTAMVAVSQGSHTIEVVWKRRTAGAGTIGIFAGSGGAGADYLPTLSVIEVA